MSQQQLSEVINHPLVQSGYSVLKNVFDTYHSMDATLVFNLFFLSHAFIVALMVKRCFDGLIAKGKVKEIPFVAGMLLCFAIGTGGAILNSLLLGKPQIFFDNDTISLYLICAWIITIYAPFNLVEVILGNAFVQLFTFAAEGFFVGGFCIGGVNRGIDEYPQSHFAPIILGTVACIGGGAILRPFFVNLYVGESIEGSVLSSPNFILKAPILASVFFYVTKVVFKFNVIEIPLSLIPVKEISSQVITFTPEQLVKTYFVLHFIIIYYISHPFFQKAPKQIKKTSVSSTVAEPTSTTSTADKSSIKKKETRKNNFSVFYHSKPTIGGESDSISFNTTNSIGNIKLFTKTICDFGNRIPSISPGYYQTQEYIKSTIENYTKYYKISYDNFTAVSTPIFGDLKMSNIIVDFTPPDLLLESDRKRIILACHYESKYFKDSTFVGATDSVVPLAMILNFMIEFEYYYNETINSGNKLNYDLQIVLFDGEEAFDYWSNDDSLYGSRHLAGLWYSQNKLSSIKYLMLLDLIGTADVRFKNFYIHKNGGTNSLFSRMSTIEKIKYGATKFFSDGISYSGVDDDHRPFLERGVPIIHLISEPFPSVWHTLRDDFNHLDWKSNERIYDVIASFLKEQLIVRKLA